MYNGNDKAVFTSVINAMFGSFGEEESRGGGK